MQISSINQEILLIYETLVANFMLMELFLWFKQFIKYMEGCKRYSTKNFYHLFNFLANT